MHTLWLSASIFGGATLLLSTFLTILGKFGPAARRLADTCCRAPSLDLIVAALTWLPWAAAFMLFRWTGVAGAVLGQLAALTLWIFGHELAHFRAARGPRIVKFINRTVGRWRNHAALWVTVISFPIFWFVRAGQVFTYPFLSLLIGLPRYKHAEWVNVSRQKFSGLVGHDLIWCLYCDWMTGVYSLGGEMLRNVESFWCPIRFYDGKKCENCRTDFPDIDGGWVRADGNMKDVEATMQEMYGHGRREWFGHPARKTPIAPLTINGVPVTATTTVDTTPPHESPAATILPPLALPPAPPPIAPTNTDNRPDPIG